jgi:hypothetical protein
MKPARARKVSQQCAAATPKSHDAVSESELAGVLSVSEAGIPPSSEGDKEKSS